MKEGRYRSFIYREPLSKTINKNRRQVSDCLGLGKGPEGFTTKKHEGTIRDAGHVSDLGCGGGYKDVYI